MYLKSIFYCTKRIIVLFLFLNVLTGFITYSQNNNVINAVNNLHDYNLSFPQQKAYLHIDKEIYYPGENMWIKAYLVNAASHKPDTLSSNLFVELVDNKGKNVSAIVLNLDNGLAWGDMQIPESISDGNYMIRAYTTWMLNFNKDFIYETPVYIGNMEEENYISWSEARKNRRFNRKLESKKETFSMNFYPEGGDITAEVSNKVAFKASDELGNGVKVKGEVFNDEGKTVAEFKSQHLGMGYFEFKPAKGEKYFAKVLFPEGSSKIIKLPRVYDSGYVLRIDNLENSDDLYVNIESAGNVGEKLAIIATTRGDVKYFDEFSLTNNKANLAIPKGMFSTGISTITLFDENATPLAERLVFINKKDFLTIDFRKTYGSEKGSDIVEISLSDPSRSTVKGSFSMGITKVPDNSQGVSGIIAELLLNSDLKGFIQDPGYYFDYRNQNAHEYLDLLMMTHGWRRFDLEKISYGEFPKIKYEIMSGLTIEGRVAMPSSRRGVEFASVEMMVHGDAEKIYHAEANSNGIFVISELDYYGPFKAEFSAKRLDLGTNLRIEIESSEMLSRGYNFNINTSKRNITERGENWVRRSLFSFSDDFKDDPGFNPSESSDAHYLTNPDQVIYLEDIKSPQSTLGEVLRGRVTGMSYDPSGQLMIRGPSSMLGSSQPAFFIDQIQIDQQRFMFLNPHEIDRVEIYKGSSAAILGVRGANGALLAYSKRGGIEYLRTFLYQFMGYNTPREFYVQSEEELGRQRMPCDHQTIFWTSDLETTDKDRVVIDFTKDLEPGKYVLRVEGLTFDGRLGSLREIIEISK